MAGETERMIGTLDWPIVDGIFRKAAYCRAFASEMHITSKRNFIARFKTLETPPPQDIRNDAESIYRQSVRQAASAIYNAEFVDLGKLIAREMSAIHSKGRDIREAFEAVHKHNSNTLWWLAFGQYTTALVGLGAGVALVVVGTGGAVSLAAAAAAGNAATATFLTLKIGGGAAALTGTSIACNVAISTTRGWADAQAWEGLAVGGIDQAKLELKRQAAGYTVGGTVGAVEEILTTATKSIVDPKAAGSEFADLVATNTKLIKGISRIGYTSLPLIFAGFDLYTESTNFQHSVESPNARAERMQAR